MTHFPTSPTPPADWKLEALTLEEQGRVAEAAQVIRDNVPHIGCAASIAEMHRRCMNRFPATGDRAPAEESFKAASDWMRTYASWATSGGEGTALSRERGEFRLQLVAGFGQDPAS